MRKRFSQTPAFTAQVLRSFGHHHGLHYAAGTGLRCTLALFPLLLAAVTLLNVTGDLGALSNALDALAKTQAIPGESLHAIRDQLDDLDEPTASELVGGIAAFLLGVWSAGAALRTLTAGLNECLGFRDHRPFLQRFVASLLLAAAVSVLGLAALFAVVFGDGIGDHLHEVFGSGNPIWWLWHVVRFPLAAVLVAGSFALLYALAPADRRQPRWFSPGICVAVVLWFVFAFAFSAYTDVIARGGAVYGAFAGLIALQLYMYWSAAIVLLGAEVDRALGTRGSAAERIGRRALRWLTRSQR